MQDHNCNQVNYPDTEQKKRDTGSLAAQVKKYNHGFGMETYIYLCPVCHRQIPENGYCCHCRQYFTIPKQ